MEQDHGIYDGKVGGGVSYGSQFTEVSMDRTKALAAQTQRK